MKPPAPDDRERLLERLAAMPDFVAGVFEGLSDPAAMVPGPEGTFSPVEHCWHLADLEREGFAVRVARLRDETEPRLADFDGERIARARRYRTRRLDEGLAAFRVARAATLRAFAVLDEADWSRSGSLEGHGPMALSDLPALMAEHDAAHRAEIVAWARARAGSLGIRLRPETALDEGAIHAVNRAAFPTDVEARIVAALRAAGDLSVSLVAEEVGRVVGHIAFSPVTVAGASDGLGLGPMAVVPECQRCGAGSQLVSAGLQAAVALGAGFVVVLGEPRYYGRFGFEPAALWGLSDAYGGGAAFQALELRPDAIPRGAGLVRYARAFALAEGEHS